MQQSGLPTCCCCSIAHPLRRGSWHAQLTLAIITATFWPAPSANTCSAGGLSNPAAGANYSSCTDGDTTGDTCTPTCMAGYFPVTNTGVFELLCGAASDFSAPPTALKCKGEAQGRAAVCVRAVYFTTTRAFASLFLASPCCPACAEISLTSPSVVPGRTCSHKMAVQCKTKLSFVRTHTFTHAHPQAHVGGAAALLSAWPQPARPVTRASQTALARRSARVPSRAAGRRGARAAKLWVAPAGTTHARARAATTAVAGPIRHACALWANCSTRGQAHAAAFAGKTVACACADVVGCMPSLSLGSFMRSWLAPQKRVSEADHAQVKASSALVYSSPVALFAALKVVAASRARSYVQQSQGWMAIAARYQVLAAWRATLAQTTMRRATLARTTMRRATQVRLAVRRATQTQAAGQRAMRRRLAARGAALVNRLSFACFSSSVTYLHSYRACATCQVAQRAASPAHATFSF